MKIKYREITIHINVVRWLKSKYALGHFMSPFGSHRNLLFIAVRRDKQMRCLCLTTELFCLVPLFPSQIPQESSS